MSSSSNSKPTEQSSKVTEETKQESQPHLGVLEEDDEFEEFPVAGRFETNSFIIMQRQPSCLDWDDSKTDLAHLGGAAPGAAKSGGDKLWEDNWDDDDIEDEFSVQLRYT